jgi:hypothetical protein
MRTLHDSSLVMEEITIAFFCSRSLQVSLPREAIRLDPGREAGALDSAMPRGKTDELIPAYIKP